MTFDSIDPTLWLCAILLEGAVLAIILWRGMYRTLPIFSCFLFWCLLSDAGRSAMQLLPNVYLQATLVNMTVDALFQIAILRELGKAVVRHNHARPPS